jgi:2-C-methyl-D-erythritol 2,4-cyclodiphosphate synthase
MVRVGFGHDSHRFEPEQSGKQLMLGGAAIPGCPGLQGNSDADVILHALTNAISGVSGINILGAVADRMCLDTGLTDSAAYVREALRTLEQHRITHVSISIEAARPKLAAHIEIIRTKVGALLGLSPASVGCTATTGEKLTAFGRGEGIQAFVVVTAQKI